MSLWLVGFDSILLERHVLKFRDMKGDITSSSQALIARTIQASIEFLLPGMRKTQTRTIRLLAAEVEFRGLPERPFL
jgi:hypothetical protein